MGVKTTDHDDVLLWMSVVLSLAESGWMVTRSTTMERIWQKRHSIFSRKKDLRSNREQMDLKRWIRSWRTRFDLLGVQLMVADVAQSSVVVDVAERTVILAPHLTVISADTALRGLYKWCRHEMENRGSEFCTLLTC